MTYRLASLFLMLFSPHSESGVCVYASIHVQLRAYRFELFL
jgi:L-alanine-DL-glutamate epimerase-like enolase superfamily enzyme